MPGKLTVEDDALGGNKAANGDQVPSPAGSVEIVDVGFLDEDRYQHAIVLDIQLRNAGGQVAYVRAVTVNVRKAWRLEPKFITGAFVQALASYDVEITTEGIPYSVTKAITQAIQPHAVDRFTLRLRSPSHHVILADLDLTYDAGDKKLPSASLLFAQAGSACEYPVMTPEKLSAADAKVSQLAGTWTTNWPEERRAIIHNNSVRDELRSIKAIRHKSVRELESD